MRIPSERFRKKHKDDYAEGADAGKFDKRETVFQDVCGSCSKIVAEFQDRDLDTIEEGLIERSRQSGSRYNWWDGYHNEDSPWYYICTVTTLFEFPSSISYLSEDFREQIGMWIGYLDRNIGFDYESSGSKEHFCSIECIKAKMEESDTWSWTSGYNLCFRDEDFSYIYHDPKNMIIKKLTLDASS